MDTSTWISLIIGIISLVLGGFSIYISFIFFKWSNKANKDMAQTSTEITERTDYLGKLFDKMFDSTFTLVKDESEAMRKHLFDNKDTGNYSSAKGSKTIDIVCFLKEKKQKTSEEICSELKISSDEFHSALKELLDKSLISVENGKYFFNESSSQNDLGSSEQ